LFLSLSIFENVFFEKLFSIRRTHVKVSIRRFYISEGFNSCLIIHFIFAKSFDKHVALNLFCLFCRYVAGHKMELNFNHKMALSQKFEA